MTLDKEMMAALEADGEKLRQMTGEDHGPYFFDEPCEVCGVWPCAHTDPADWYFDATGTPVPRRSA